MEVTGKFLGIVSDLRWANSGEYSIGNFWVEVERLELVVQGNASAEKHKGGVAGKACLQIAGFVKAG